jgi:hypothetical protein
LMMNLRIRSPSCCFCKDLSMMALLYKTCLFSECLCFLLLKVSFMWLLSVLFDHEPWWALVLLFVLGVVLVGYWRSLTSTLYLQLMHNIMEKGLLVHSCRVYSDKFHELCCSHLFCRIIDISPHKSISNDKTKHTIVKISSRRSK